MLRIMIAAALATTVSISAAQADLFEGFGAYDTDGTAGITSDEYRDGVFTSYDVDRNNMIDEREYGYLGRSFGERDIKEYDADGDGMLNRDEYNTYYDRSGVYRRYDANSDGLLDENEYRAGSLYSYDRNYDNEIGEDEFDLF